MWSTSLATRGLLRGGTRVRWPGRQHRILSDHVSTPPKRRRFFRRKWPFAVIGGAVAALVGIDQYAQHQSKSLTDDGLSTEYDAAAIDDYWLRYPAIAFRRLRVIAWEVLPFVGSLSLEILVGQWTGNRRLETEARQVEVAREFRQILTELGPTFIKFGQMLSIRPDILPSPVLRELQKLCDAVPPYSTTEALELIESELGKSIAEVFIDLNSDSVPIAAASLGQVYRCRLRDSNEEVAVKVQRPDMLRNVSLDLFLLRRYFRFVEAFKEFLMDQFPTWVARRRQFDLELFDAFAKASLYELDYIHEGRNQDFFAEKLNSMMADDVYVPKVFWSASSTKVLSTEWINGTPLASSAPEEIERLVPVGVECFLVQLLELGQFHSDPHPGNLFVEDEVSPHSPKGRRRLVLLDFGLCARIERPSMLRIATALVHLIENDIDELLQDCIALGFLDATADLASLRPALTTVLDQGRDIALETATDGIASKITGKTDYAAIARRRKQFWAVSNELNDIFFHHPFTVPDYFALITRALIVLEGIALTGDPNFDIFKASYPFARKSAIRTIKNLSLKEAADLVRKAATIEKSMLERG